MCPVYKMDRFDVVRKVPHLTDEQLKDVRVEDRALMIDVWQICQELAYHRNMSADEPHVESNIATDAVAHCYELWVLYPPGRCEFTGAEICSIATLGLTHNGRFGFNDITFGHDPKSVPVRSFIRVRILMANAPFKREVKRKIIKEEVVEYYPTGRIASEPDGVAVRRQVKGTTFSNSNSPRPNKRPRVDVSE